MKIDIKEVEAVEGRMIRLNDLLKLIHEEINDPGRICGRGIVISNVVINQICEMIGKPLPRISYERITNETSSSD